MIESFEDNPCVQKFWETLQNPRATGKTLSEIHAGLSGRWEARIELWEALAQHPNCPPDIFAELLLSFPHAAVANPSWELLLLEGVLANEMSLLRQLQQANLPQPYVAVLSQHPSTRVRSIIQEHVAFAGEVEGDLREALLHKLATLRRDGRLVWLARFGAFPERLNDYLPYPIVESPPRRSHPLVKRWNPNEELLDFLNEADGGYEPREAFLESCAQSKGELAPLLATAQIASPELLLSLGNRYILSFDWRRQLGVVLNPQAARVPKYLASLLGRFRNDGNRWVRAVARKRLADPSWRLF